MFIAFAKTKGNVESLQFHSHNEYEIYVFHEGNCQYIVDDKVIQLRPGTILLMDGRSIHKARVLSNESEYVRSVVHFPSDFIDGSKKYFGYSEILSYFEEGDVGIRHVSKSENLDKIVYIIEDLKQLSEIEDSEEINKEIQLGIIKLLLVINRFSESTFSSNDIKSNIKEYYTEKIIEHMHNNFSEKLTIKNMSQEFNLSASYMSRVFKETTGYTIMQYLMYYRFTQAKYLIEVTDNKTFTEIASDCGFPSSAHFSRFIKEQTGMTPTRFKKDIQEKSFISPKNLKQIE